MYESMNSVMMQVPVQGFSPNPGYKMFVETWQQAVIVLMFGALAYAFFVLLAYYAKYNSRKDPKKKYDLASTKEVSVLFQANLGIAVALFLFINYLEPETVKLDMVWFFVRFFIAFCIGILHAYIAHLVLKYYYPGPLSKKLNRLRYSPRINKKTGNSMKLLSEDEEDAYLDEGMQAEENVFSVDYDVWIDEATGGIHIEKYPGHLTALECDRCGFMTLRLTKEEIVKPVSDFQDGELLKEYNCSYCGRIKRKNVVISRKVQETKDGNLVYDASKEKKKVAALKLDIFSNQDDHVTYNFKSLEQVKKFLNEFEFKE